MLPAKPSSGRAAKPAETPIRRKAAAPVAPTPRPAPAPPRFAPPRILWRTNLRRCDSTPAVGENAIYIGAGSYLYCLDSGGRTKWMLETGPRQSSPVQDEAKVYVGSDRAILYAVDRNSGKVAWQFRAQSTLLTAPAVGGPHVYVESTDNNVYAVDRRSGVLRWRFARRDGSLGYSSPHYTPHAVYVCGETTLYALDPESGRELWDAPIGGTSLSTPAEGGRRVFVGGDDTGLTAVGSDGQRLWRFTGREQGDWFGTPLYMAGTVYVTTYRRYVYAVDAVSGREKWSTRILVNGLARPAFDTARNVLYVTAETFRDNPTLWAFDARNGKPMWNYRGGSMIESPAIQDNRLYAGSINGFFYAFAL